MAPAELAVLPGGGRLDLFTDIRHSISNSTARCTHSPSRKPTSWRMSATPSRTKRGTCSAWITPRRPKPRCTTRRPIARSRSATCTPMISLASARCTRERCPNRSTPTRSTMEDVAPRYPQEWRAPEHPGSSCSAYCLAGECGEERSGNLALAAENHR